MTEAPIVVSIITVCYNAAAGIESCVQSVVRQSYPQIQYIVIDGGSTDGTLEVLHAARQRIAVLVSEPDGGIYAAMNKGLERATGDLIYFINADDYLVDDRVVADVVRYIETHPHGDLYYGSIELRQAGGSIGVHEPDGPEKAVETMVCGCLPHQATFARRRVFERTGPFDESYRYHADYDWFLKAIADPDIALVRLPRVVASFQLGGASSQLAQGQPEAYRIQNASPLYASEEWSRRRIAIYQATLLAARIENADLKAKLAARRLSGPMPRAVVRLAAIGHALADWFVAKARLVRSALYHLYASTRAKGILSGSYQLSAIAFAKPLLGTLPISTADRARDGLFFPRGICLRIASEVDSQPSMRRIQQDEALEGGERMMLQSSLAASPSECALEKIIPPEIKNDEFYDLISNLAAREPLRHVLEIGSAAGGGSTEALVKGLSLNPGSALLFCIEVSRSRFKALQETYKHLDFVRCYNMSTVAPGEFPSEQSIADFYARADSSLRKFPLPTVLDWLRQDKRYVREAGVESGAIERIKAEHGISDFDLVLIDGSEFTGELEFRKVYGARVILLDDTTTYKNFAVRRQLLNDPNYELLADNQGLRNGYSAFRRRSDAKRPLGEDLPINFFTIVLNGEPFIRYHEQVFRRLPFRWHWHIVEGVASLTHDTAWSTASGGRIDKAFHDGGRSNDGTSGYLDELARRYPDRVSIYRKPRGVFWDGKREMVNAPLANIQEPCLLWQVDADELWTEEQIVTVRRMFMAEPHRSAARYWCWYFVGPGKVIGTRHNYAQNPRQEWLRTWRFEPGDHWAAHEPPTLVRPKGNGSAPVDVARIRPFGHDEMEAAGAVFQHFAYVTEDQLRFKETYYGYGKALAHWRKLQQHKGSGFLRDYLPWVGDNAMFGEAGAYNVQPIATYDAAAGRWSFGQFRRQSGSEEATTKVKPRIVVDGIFYQYLASGVGRVWTNLLQEWAKSGFAEHVVVLDRAGTAPRIAGVHYRTIAAHDYRQTGRDSLYLERVCRELEADLFVSTYYSTPTDTPSAFMGHDMIPEVLGFDLADETWKEKRRAIQHASAHIMVSANSARDLERIFPLVTRGSTTIAHCGVAVPFRPAGSTEIEAFKRRHGLTKPYILSVGERLGVGGYKNGFLLFRAVSLLPDPTQFTVVCVGGAEEIEAPLRALVPGTDVRRLKLDDDALRAAYSGAHAYVCSSRYEGFGLPIVEAMACGCPVVACRTSSIPEVAGDAALFVGEDDAEGLAKALLSLNDSALRASCIRRGTAQAGLFSFQRMSQIAAKALLDTAEGLRRGTHRAPAPAWKELRRLQQTHQAAEIRSAVAAAEGACGVQPTAAGIAPASDDLTRALNVIETMQRSPFWKLRGMTIAVLARLGVRKRTPAPTRSEECPRAGAVATAARVNPDASRAHQAQAKPQAPPATDARQRRARRTGALSRKIGKLVTGLKALADLRAYYENFQRFEAEVRAQVQQVAASTAQVAERIQDVSSSTAKLGGEFRRIAETTKRLEAAVGTDPSSREALYYKGLRAVGILNYENARISGEHRFLSHYLGRHPEATVVDVGANVGRYAQMVRALAPRARIIAIEPHPGSFERLARTSQAIGAEALLTAVGDEVGEVAIYDYEDADGSEHASLYREVIEKIHGRPAGSHNVPCEPLDRIAGRLALPSIGLLKIDTEGHELAVLRGAKKLIEAGAIDVIQFEFNEMNVISRTFFLDFMRHLPNYRFFRLLADGAVSLDTYSPRFMEIFAYQNVVCVRSGLDTSWIEGASAA